METNGPGQPTKYREEYCEMLIKHMEQGNSFWSFAGVVSVCFDTLSEWCKQHKQFSEAKSIGIAKLLIHDEAIGKGGTLGQLERRSSTTKTRTTDKDGNVTEHEVTTYKPARFAAGYHQFVMKNRYSKFYKDEIKIETPTQDKEKAAELVKDVLENNPEVANVLKELAKKQSDT